MRLRGLSVVLQLARKMNPYALGPRQQCLIPGRIRRMVLSFVTGHNDALYRPRTDAAELLLKKGTDV